MCQLRESHFSCAFTRADNLSAHSLKWRRSRNRIYRMTLVIISYGSSWWHEMTSSCVCQLWWETIYIFIDMSRVAQQRRCHTGKLHRGVKFRLKSSMHKKNYSEKWFHLHSAHVTTHNSNATVSMTSMRDLIKKCDLWSSKIQCNSKLMINRYSIINDSVRHDFVGYSRVTFN